MKNSVRRFAGFSYSLEGGLERAGRPVKLGPQARQLLELLLDAKGEIVPKDEIASKLWPGQEVSDDSIDRCAYLLRKPLKAVGLPELVATAYGRGLYLRAEIEESGDERPKAITVADSKALELWQTAYELAGRRTREGYSRAQEAIAAAAQVQPDNGAVLALSAELYAGQAMRGYVSPVAAARLIEEQAGRALELSPGFAPALAVLGWARAVLVHGSEEIGIALIERSLASNAWYSKSCTYRSWALAGRDRLGEAVADAEACLRHNPMDQGLLSLHAWLVLLSGDRTEAAERSRRGLAQRPDAAMLWLVLSICASIDGDHDVAIDHARRGLDCVGEDPFAFSVLVYALACAGRRDEAAAALARADAVDGAEIPLTFRAAAVLALGRTDDAREQLQRASRLKCPHFGFARYDERLAPLRSDILKFAGSARKQAAE